MIDVHCANNWGESENCDNFSVSKMLSKFPFQDGYIRVIVIP